MPRRLGAAVLLAILLSSCSPAPPIPAPPSAEPGSVQLDPVTLSLLPGETASVYATKVGDPGFTDFTWSQAGLDIRPDGHAAEVTAPARPGSYDLVVDAGDDGPDSTVRVTVRAPGQTADVDARQDILVEGGAVRSARRPTTGGLYLPETQQTVISWMGEEGHPYVAAYDHTRAAWGQPARIGTNPDPDYHNYPVLTQAADGHLIAVYGAHDSPMRVARSARPGSADGSWTSTTVAAAPASSYPFPFRAVDGRVFVFYRETLDRLGSQYVDDDRPLRYVVSADNGLTWRNSTDLTGDPFALGSVDRPDNLDEIYVGQVRYLPATDVRRERVLISWTIAGGGPDGSKHDRYHRNMYVAYFRPYDLHFESVAGKDLGTQLTNDEMEGDCKALDTGDPRFAMDSDDFDTHDVDYISVVDERADGRPVVVFTTFDGEDATTHYSVWTGTSWQDRTGDFGQPTDMELRGSVLHAYVSDPGQYESWVMTGDDATFQPGVVHRFDAVPGTGLETLITNYRQPLQFISGGRGFEGVSDASPELDVGVIGVP